MPAAGLTLNNSIFLLNGLRPFLLNTSALGNQLRRLSGLGYTGSVFRGSTAAQWFSNGTPISGATGLDYTVTDAVRGTLLSQSGKTYQLPAPPLSYGTDTIITYGSLPVTYGTF